MVNRSSAPFFCPRPPPPTETWTSALTSTIKQALACLSGDDVRSSFVALLALGSLLPVMIDIKRWRGMDIRLGKTQPSLDSARLRAANDAHLLPILPVTSNSDANGVPTTSPRCKYRALGVYIVPWVCISRLSRHCPSPRKQRVRFPRSTPQAFAPDVVASQASRTALKPRVG